MNNEECTEVLKPLIAAVMRLALKRSAENTSPG